MPGRGRTRTVAGLLTCVGILALASTLLATPMVQAAPSAMVSAQSPTAAPVNPPAFAPGRILIEAKAGVSDAEFAATLNGQGGRSLGKLRGLRAHLVSVPPGQSESAFAERLARHPHIKFAELDRLAPPGTTTNDPLLPSQWHLPRIDATTAWNTSTGAGTVIAILDTGIDPTHPDLKAQLVPGWNFYSGNSDTSDPHGHGTAVAGAASAIANNGTGVASVAWGARLMPVRIADANAYAYWSTVAQGLTWAADNGARVANVSYVGVAASSTVQSAANYMRNKGGVVVVCAGNNGKDEGIASTDSMIVVSATNSSDAKASWSSYGSFVDLAAPGESIYTTSRGGGYQYWSGTSLASPVVAGAAAMIKSLRPELTAPQIESALFTSSVDLGTAGKDATYGYGRLNSAAALVAAGKSTPDTTAPTVAITAPTGGTLSGSVNVSVSAADNIGVTRVELMANGRLIGTDTAAPYSFAWNTTTTANGPVTLTAFAYDSAGNSGLSAAVSVAVSNTLTADTTPPEVSISSPTEGLKIGSTLTISASARDAGGLAWLQVAIDGIVVSSTTNGSISYKWNTRKERTGTHTIVVLATDKAGNKTSRSVDVVK